MIKDSIKKAVAQKTESAEIILDECGINQEDKERLLDIIKGLAFEWCSSNAHAKAMEYAMISIYPDLDIMAFTKLMLESAVYDETLMDTYPY